MEFRCGSDILILDAGTGIRSLGYTLAKSPNREIDILLSHLHIDHVIGLPFFAPLFAKDQVVRLWAGNLLPDCTVENAVRKLMAFPLFPLKPEALQAKLEFRDFRAGDTIDLRPGVTLRTAPLNHPGGATAYRIDCGTDRSIAYVTDTEIGDGPIDPVLLSLTKNVELVIVDASYTDEELPSHAGWGHSSWQQAIRLANEANAGKLCLFHHDPEHNDAFMDLVAAAAESARPGTIVAREGLFIEL